MTTLAAPGGGTIRWTGGRVRLRARGPIVPGAEAASIEYRRADTGGLLATLDMPALAELNETQKRLVLRWSWRETLQGSRVRSELTWSVPTDDDALEHWLMWGNDVVLWFAGEVLHRGPMFALKADAGTLEFTAPDTSAWLDHIICRHPHPGDPEWEKWDPGQVVSMRQAWQHHPLTLAGGELSTSVPAQAGSYAYRTAGEVCDLVVDSQTTVAGNRWWWWVENSPDLTRRVSWADAGRVIPPEEVTLSFLLGERGTVTTLDLDVSGAGVVSSPVIVTSDNRGYAYDHPEVHPRGLPIERRFTADPGTDEGPVNDQYIHFTYQSIVETVPPESSWTIEVVDRSIGQRIRSGDRVWINTDVPGLGPSRYETVTERMIPDEGPIKLTVGTSPAPRQENFWRAWQERLRELEEQRRGASESNDLQDWKVEDPEDPEALADPAREPFVPKPGQVAKWQPATYNGVRKLKLSPASVLDPLTERQWSNDEIVSDRATISAAAPEDRRWLAMVTIAIGGSLPNYTWDGVVLLSDSSTWAGGPDAPPGATAADLSDRMGQIQVMVVGRAGEDLWVQWYGGGDDIDGAYLSAVVEFIPL